MPKWKAAADRKHIQWAQMAVLLQMLLPGGIPPSPSRQWSVLKATPALSYEIPVVQPTTEEFSPDTSLNKTEKNKHAASWEPLKQSTFWKPPEVHSNTQTMTAIN